jgi:hypothetical protein
VLYPLKELDEELLGETKAVELPTCIGYPVPGVTLKLFLYARPPPPPP